MKKYPEIPVTEADPAQGLTGAQVEARRKAGLENTPPKALSKPVWRIVTDNVFTPFNFLFCLLAACLAAVGSYTDMLFLGVIFFNTVIGIVQELRVKQALEKVSLLDEAPVTAVRGGEPVPLPSAQLVRDDIVQLRAGCQVPADAVVCAGQPEVNEALLTGEADAVEKQPGDALLSGSFLAAGTCTARLTRVGAEAYAARLAHEAKRPKKYRSEMMASLDKLVRIVGFALAPLGIAMFLKQFFVLHTGLKYAVTSTVAAMIGMVPEGLYLLTSVALAVGVMTLAKRRTLARELSCIESLARVDVLCLDKTGTLTEGRMEVAQVLPAEADETGLKTALAAFLAVSEDDNATAGALRAFAGPLPQVPPTRGRIPFSSSRKWSACETGSGWLVLGAPDVVLGETVPQLQNAVSRGMRALVLAEVDGRPAGTVQDARPLGYFLLTDTVRADAPATLEYFRRQGVAVKVISGDSGAAAADIARRAGVPDAGRWVDGTSFADEASLRAAASQYTVFGRMTPGQKRILVHALQSEGHTVAMTGDGVNDVLALKDADCSIAMAAGSEAARQVAQLVLLDNDFSVMPRIVDEGRRVIHNIQRTATLFLIKNIFSFLITLILLFVPMPYPFVPLQISAFSFLCIGAPGFFLTFEPCSAPVRGRFLPTVLLQAAPGGLACTLCILAAMGAASALGLSTAALSTLCTLVILCVGLLTVATVCQPFTPLRRCVLGGVFLGIVTAVLFFHEWLGLTALPLPALGVLLGLWALACLCFWLLSRLCTSIRRRMLCRAAA